MSNNSDYWVCAVFLPIRKNGFRFPAVWNPGTLEPVVELQSWVQIIHTVEYIHIYMYGGVLKMGASPKPWVSILKRSNFG